MKLKEAIIQKMLENASTLKMTELFFKRGKMLQNHLYEWNIAKRQSNLKTLQEIFIKSACPFDYNDGVDFVKGRLNNITFDNGYRTIKVSI